jgi:hypothetical protein
MSWDWERAAHKATVFQTALVLVSIGFIWWQLKQQNDLANAANIQKLAESSSALHLLLAQNDRLAAAWVEGKGGFRGAPAKAAEAGKAEGGAAGAAEGAAGAGASEEGKKLTKEQYKHLLIWQMIFYENMFYQNSQGLLDETMYSAWDNDLKTFAKEHPCLKSYWDARGDLYHQEFGRRVKAILDELQKQGAQPCVLP